MATRRHVHEEILPTSRDRLFALLHTPSAIREWWGAARVVVIPEAGGFFAAAWGEDEDDPDYVSSAIFAVFDPPRRLVMTEQRYRAKDGPLPFAADFTTEFQVEARDEGALLRVIQDGFPTDASADGFLKACEQGWRQTFAGIRRHLAGEGSTS
jgi:uncharacterized protein YndB with AHSA1/START domain